MGREQGFLGGETYIDDLLEVTTENYSCKCYGFSAAFPPASFGLCKQGTFFADRHFRENMEVTF